jgi:hypothetical protein
MLQACARQHPEPAFEGKAMVEDSIDKAKGAPQKSVKMTTYPGKNDGRISASKHANIRTGSNRPAPKKK